MSVKCKPPYTPRLYSKIGVYMGIQYFLIFALKQRLWILVTPPQNKKNINHVQQKIVIFTASKILSILHRRVIVMSRYFVFVGRRQFLFLLMSSVGCCHYANTPMQYTAIFHGCRYVHFQMKILIFFLMFAQNIDCGYTLEPPQRTASLRQF